MLHMTRVAELREDLAGLRSRGLRVALVPTMGNLHEGHLELVRLARQHAECVVCSIFVNPTQFGPGEDYASYPRTLARDAEMLRAEGVHALFAPGVEQMYPLGLAQATEVRVQGLADILCGAVRPGHFNGVATVVLRLLNMVMPQVAVFGQKDYQQQLIIRRLVADLNVPAEILTAPTSRESDGLARSSRNQYLTAEERTRAPALYAALQTLAAGLSASEDNAAALCAGARQHIQAAGLIPEYVELRDAATLAPASPGHRPLIALAAARLGRARLIDNLLIA
ncbi:MAG: pantoate--beta-alanine ligase [Gammaproteobacteria bacterium]|nr:pantoate--beta-alanine ligase [Gammaproteobacteria bacterium]